MKGTGRGGIAGCHDAVRELLQTLQARPRSLGAPFPSRLDGQRTETLEIVDAAGESLDHLVDGWIGQAELTGVEEHVQDVVIQVARKERQRVLEEVDRCGYPAQPQVGQAQHPQRSAAGLVGMPRVGERQIDSLVLGQVVGWSPLP